MPVQFFREGAPVVAYCPALDLSSCGTTLAETRQNIVEAIGLLVEQCRQRGTLETALLACDWQRVGAGQQPQLPPPELMSLEDMPLPALK